MTRLDWLAARTESHLVPRRPRLGWVAASGLALSLSACSPDVADGLADAVELAAHDGTGVSLRRVGSGPILAGDTLTMQAVLPDGVALSDLRWETDDGAITGDGERIRWTLPDRSGRMELRLQTVDGRGEPHISRFGVGVVGQRAYVTAQQGIVATGGPYETVGSSCVLRFDSGSAPHILYRNDAHGSLYVAAWNGAAWAPVFVDGPGFDVGSVISDRFDFELDSSDNYHVAYAYFDRQNTGYDWETWWASDATGSWTRERVTINYDGMDRAWPSLALDPINGERPTVGHTQDTSYDRMAVSYRTGPGAWTIVPYNENGYSQYHTGGSAFSPDGVLHLTKGLTSHAYMTLTASATYSSPTYLDYSTNSHYRAPMVVDDDGYPVFMHANGLEHRAGGTTWRHSEIELFELDRFDLAWGGGKPHVVLLHDGNVEMITTDADGYWEYTVIDTGVDDANPSIAVDNDGDPHVCYAKNGALYYY